MIDIESFGAAEGVTGSMHLVRTPQARILLDYGLFQGHRRDANRRNRKPRAPIREIDAIVLSHAHIDHSGAMPIALKRGYRGAIYATPATRDLCSVMLADSAAIQLQDATYINAAIERGQSDMDPVEPLYDQDDVEKTIAAMREVPYRQPREIAKGVRLTFLDAGHVLGSAIVVLDIDDEGLNRRLVFTGDLGRRDMPILRDPEIPSGTNILVMESTYGDRLHAPNAAMKDELARITAETVARGGKVIIPTFALERAQEVIYALRSLHGEGRLPDVPVYMDSPLATRITDVFRRHPEVYDRETRALIKEGQSPFEFPTLRYVTEVSDSRAIDAAPGPAIILAASGMCEFGRVVHHLRAFVEDPKSTVVIVGFMAQHTLGRRLVERRSRVRVLGVERDRRCKVEVLNGFSAHADQADLVDFAARTRDAGPLRHVLLVHGEPPALRALRQELHALDFPDVRISEERSPQRF